MNNNLRLILNSQIRFNAPQELPETDSEVLVDEGRALILYNDDYNTFDHVIKCLVEICDHTALQAEQCAFIVHYNGKCDVMHGDDSQLDVCCRLLQLKGLSATIE